MGKFNVKVDRTEKEAAKNLAGVLGMEVERSANTGEGEGGGGDVSWVASNISDAKGGL